MARTVSGLAVRRIEALIDGQSVTGLSDRQILDRFNERRGKDGPVSEAKGQIAFPALVPGATYRRTPRGTRGSPLSDEFTIKPGETLDLGDILIEKPSS